jgi:hypothetical protein
VKFRVEGFRLVREEKLLLYGIRNGNFDCLFGCDAAPLVAAEAAGSIATVSQSGARLPHFVSAFFGPSSRLEESIWKAGISCLSCIARFIW